PASSRSCVTLGTTIWSTAYVCVEGSKVKILGRSCSGSGVLIGVLRVARDSLGPSAQDDMSRRAGASHGLAAQARGDSGTTSPLGSPCSAYPYAWSGGYGSHHPVYDVRSCHSAY